MTEFKIKEGFESVDVIVSVNTKNIFSQLFGTTPLSQLTVEQRPIYDAGVELFEYTSDDKKHLPEFKTGEDINTDLRNLLSEKYEPITITKPILEAMLGFLPKLNIQGHITIGLGVFSALEEEGAIELVSDLLEFEEAPIDPEGISSDEIEIDDMVKVLDIIHKVALPNVKETGVYKSDEFLESIYLSKVVKDLFDTKSLDLLSKLSTLFDSKYEEAKADFTLFESKAIKKYFNIEL